MVNSRCRTGQHPLKGNTVFSKIMEESANPCSERHTYFLAKMFRQRSYLFKMSSIFLLFSIFTHRFCIIDLAHMSSPC